MRILLDARFTTRSGAASYIENLLPKLLALDSPHEFMVLKYSTQQLKLDSEIRTIELPAMSAWRHALWDQYALPKMLRRLGIDLCHCMKTLGPLRTECRILTVGHSITVPYRGEFPAGLRQRLYWNLLGSELYRRSSAVIAVSDFVKGFLVEAIGVSKNRIHVIPHGVDPGFRVLGSELHAESTLSGEPYILVVGNVFPVKNQITAVSAFSAIAQRHPDLKLVIAGGTSHPYFKQVQQLTARLGLSDKIEFLGFTPKERLATLMNHARLLLLPSLTEGCPVTLLEAMACGLPTVASRRGGIPEVGGDAIVLVDDPMDVDCWIETTDRILNNEALRNDMQRRSLQRVTAFSWDKAAAKTLRLYESLN